MNDSWPVGGAVALILVGVALACSGEVDAGSAWLASVPCAGEVRSALLDWGAGEDMLVSAPAGAHTGYRFPTNDLGTWLLLEVGSSQVTLSRVEPDRVTVRRLPSDCTASTTEEPVPAPDPGRELFTDAALEGAVDAAGAEGRAGVVVYVWSPHMPLSVDGYPEIEAAAAEHGLALVPVLFPGSDAAFAATEADRAGMPEEGLREAASVELAFRDAQVHAPSILVFDGVRVSAVLPGYRSAEGYREFLTGFLAP